jgi:hypothetical protein
MRFDPVSLQKFGARRSDGALRGGDRRSSAIVY